MENNDLIQRELKELECMEECDSDVLVAELTKNNKGLNQIMNYIIVRNRINHGLIIITARSPLVN